MQGLDERQLEDILVRAVGAGRAAVALEAFRKPASVSVRINPSKPVTFAGSREVPWCGWGRMLPERPVFTLDPLFHAGCYYVQDSSAMAVGRVFRDLLGEYDVSGRPLKVLDLCAAPGGKTTDLAASLRLALGNGFELVANEVIRSRAAVLADNVAVWGDPNVIVTSVDPREAGRLEGYFDIILADVPCSGEGMFRKDAKAVEDWSEETVKLCAARQRRILADVWPALRQGGLLLYSTCTFEEAENDSAVEWAASELGGETVDYGYGALPGVIPSRTGGLLVPGFVEGEGQFVAALRKTAPSGKTRLLPEVLRPLRSGLVKGVRKGSDFIPSADWALSIEPPVEEYPMVEVDRETALKYLHRDGIFIEGQPEGFLMVLYEGHPLGFVKNLGRRWNNLHPQNRRIRMDI
ncbi:MAG: rRNA cytosine-C5-methyltransferase [Bacteroidales bacterium]|nr:rRNA cytosine-C5-methyltransferase [Bacteroidales bacterium]